MRFCRRFYCRCCFNFVRFWFWFHICVCCVIPKSVFTLFCVCDNVVFRYFHLQWKQNCNHRVHEWCVFFLLFIWFFFHYDFFLSLLKPTVQCTPDKVVCNMTYVIYFQLFFSICYFYLFALLSSSVRECVLLYMQESLWVLFMYPLYDSFCKNRFWTIYTIIIII